jgi:ribosomal protein S14
MESAYERILKIQKPGTAGYIRFTKFNKHKVRSSDARSRACVRCNRPEAHIKVHGLRYCRQCFREVAKDLGFHKYGKEA